MSNAKGFIRGFFLSSVMLSVNVAAQQDKSSASRFYDGPVRVSSVRGTIELANGANPVSRLEAVFRNSGSTSQTLAVGFRGASTDRLVLGPGQSTRLSTLTPVGRRSGPANGPQSVELDLALQINSLALADPLDTVDVQVVLPTGVPALIRASMPTTRESSAGRVSYRLTRHDLHLTALTLVYAPGPVTLLIDKRLQPTSIDHAGPVIVTLTLRNVGTAEARQIAVQDNFDPRDFAGHGVGFQLVAGKENDRRLIWSGEIDRLQPGSATTVTYTVSALMPVTSTSLSAATAVMNGQLVGVSNKIWLPSKRQ